MRAFLLNLCLASSLCAAEFYGTPRVDSIFPKSGTRGTSIEIQFRGDHLKQAESVLFYSEGLTAKDMASVEEELHYNGKMRRLKEGTAMKAVFEIAEDCRVGEHHFRLHTRGGLSDAVTFWVGHLPTVNEEEPRMRRGHNDTPDKAEVVEPNVTVNGYTGRTDVDVYQVELKKGQRLSAELNCMRLGVATRGVLPDYQLVARSPSGDVIARGDDSDMYLADPILSVVVPEDGAYTIEVSEPVPG
ncbi:MAG: PPC domain-containing protein [Verrucomicrobiota bacterium]